MKTLANKSIAYIFLLALTASGVAFAQQTDIANFRYNDRRGVNVFETPKSDIPFENIRFRVGGDFALQFQSLSQSNDGAGDNLVPLQSNFSLPTANLNIDVQLADGVRMFIRTYLSSRHHTEAYVRGGYLQMDKLDFIKPGFLSSFMEIATLRMGMDQINYGDAQFRRSDNAAALYNPFVGNYIMDAFTTEPFLEVLVRDKGMIGLVGITNGRLNQSPTPGDNGFVLYGKLGYDNYATDAPRFRLTGSFYRSTTNGTRDYLYGGDRAGARYYGIMEGMNDSRVSDFLPRHNPRFPNQTSIQLNPFMKVGGLEVFGIVERASSGAEDGGSFTQLGFETLYRFGTEEKFYLGGRYNSVNGKDNDLAGTLDKKITRINVGGGWFLTKNIVTKLEYVRQKYSDDGWSGSKFQGAEFDGFVFESAISF